MTFDPEKSVRECLANVGLHPPVGINLTEGRDIKTNGEANALAFEYFKLDAADKVKRTVRFFEECGLVETKEKAANE